MACPPLIVSGVRLMAAPAVLKSSRVFFTWAVTGTTSTDAGKGTATADCSAVAGDEWRFQLEEELRAELELTRIVSAGYLSEVAVVGSTVHLVELRMVEGVEGLRP
jgi:hypothetical protein